MNSKQYAREYKKERIAGIIKKAKQDIKQSYLRFPAGEAYHYNLGLISALRNSMDIITAKTCLELSNLNYGYYKEANSSLLRARDRVIDIVGEI